MLDDNDATSYLNGKAASIVDQYSRSPRSGTCGQAREYPISCISVTIESIEVYPAQANGTFRLNGRMIKRDMDELAGHAGFCTGPVALDRTLNALIGAEFELAIGTSERPNACAILLELSNDTASDDDRIAWVIFPLLSAWEGRHRLRFNSIGAHYAGAIPELLREGVLRVKQSQSSVCFSIYRATTEHCDARDRSVGSALAQLVHDSTERCTVPMTLLRTVECPVRFGDYRVLRFCPSAPLLAAGIGTHVFVYDLGANEMGACVERTGTVTAVEWCESALRMVCGFDDGSVTEWDLTTGNVSTFNLTMAVSAVAYSDEGLVVAAAGESVTGWVDGVIEFKVTDPCTRDIICMNPSLDGLFVVLSRTGDIVEIAPMQDWMESHSLQSFHAQVTLVAGAYFLTSDGRLRQIVGHKGVVIDMCALPRHSTAIDVSPDGLLVAVGDRRGSVSVYETKSGGLIHTVSTTLPVAVTCITWSPTHNILAFTGTEPGASLPVVFVAGAGMSASLTQWNTRWTESDPVPGIDANEVSAMKSRILSSILANRATTSQLT